MHYAKQKRMALRRRHGDRKQIFQFGTDSMPRAEMDAIADFVLGALASGEVTEDDARKYARDETRDTHASSARARPHSANTDDQPSQCSSLRRHVCTTRTRRKRAQTTRDAAGHCFPPFGFLVCGGDLSRSVAPSASRDAEPALQRAMLMATCTSSRRPRANGTCMFSSARCKTLCSVHARARLLARYATAPKHRLPTTALHVDTIASSAP